MLTIYDKGAFVSKGTIVEPERNELGIDRDTAKKNTLAWRILTGHNTSGNSENLKIRFDALVSHDITYVGIVQTARASGLTEFPVPYALTNCHNSLCAVGGTINEDDHVFGLSAAKKYGGIFVPPHLAVIHQYARETLAFCGGMILGSDSHTRYGALGTMGIGEGGPEIVKQLLKKTYDVPMPQVTAVYLDGEVQPGVGPQDVALCLIKAVFASGFVKNKVLEFIGPGVSKLSVDFRNGIDVMTTETTCLSSIWETDDKVEEYYVRHGRGSSFRKLSVDGTAYYESLIHIDLGSVTPMIALPFHPSNAYPISELNRNAGDILSLVEKEASSQLDNPKLKLNLRSKIRNGRVQVDQGIVAGCAGGTFENLTEMASILEGASTGNDAFSLSVYPASQPQYLSLIKNGAVEKLIGAGAVIKTAFCGPCFGAGDSPANGALSIRHSTRNFPNREGSKPGAGQIASVALMDARSIAATAANGGLLTGADEISYKKADLNYSFEKEVYEKRVYNGYGKPDPEHQLVFGPNIADWPRMSSLPDHLFLGVASVIKDAVTTTDELIPSGETSSYRSNPMKLAEFTLSRKDPGYVGRAKGFYEYERRRLEKVASTGDKRIPDDILRILRPALEKAGIWPKEPLLNEVGFGSVVCANRPGDGSAREQAASCQKVLGGWANIACEYATKRYRSNLINWGMLPLQAESVAGFSTGDFIFIPGIRAAVKDGSSEVAAWLVKDGNCSELKLRMAEMTPDERDIILAGCLINYYADK